MLVYQVVLDIEMYVTAVIWAGLFAAKAFAMVDAITHKDEYYVAADKQNKAFWLVLLVLAVVIDALLSLQPAIAYGTLAALQVVNLLPLIGSVAALVYLAGVRPTLREMGQHGH